MKKELNLKCPYKIFSEPEQYYFYTKSEIKYILYFKDVPYFGNFYLGYNIFEFGFETESLIRNNDADIRLTILALLNSFFSDKDKVLYYVTDSSDFKEEARNRLFDIWKKVFDKDNLFIKYSTEIKTEEETYYCSMILRRNNIHKEEYKKVFFDTGNEFELTK